MLQRQLLFPTLRFGKNQFVKDPDPISNEKFENHAYRLIDHVQGQLISPYFFILFSEFFLCVGRGHKPYFLMKKNENFNQKIPNQKFVNFLRDTWPRQDRLSLPHFLSHYFFLSTTLKSFFSFISALRYRQNSLLFDGKIFPFLRGIFGQQFLERRFLDFGRFS